MLPHLNTKQRGGIMRNYQKWAPIALRIGLGLLFLYTGIMKLVAPDTVTGMLSGIGFPVPAFWTWVLILAEGLGGLALIIGFKVKYATIPLAVILLVAILTVHLSVLGDVMLRLGLLSGVVSLWLSGPGALAVGK